MRCLNQATASIGVEYSAHVEWGDDDSHDDEQVNTHGSTTDFIRYFSSGRKEC